MRVDSRDEEAAAIIFNIVNIITWRLFLLKAAPIGRLLIWRRHRCILLGFSHWTLLRLTTIRIRISLFFEILVLALQDLEVIDVNFEFILLLLHLILLKHVNLGNIVLCSQGFIYLGCAIARSLALATCHLIVLAHESYEYLGFTTMC